MILVSMIFSFSKFAKVPTVPIFPHVVRIYIHIHMHYTHIHVHTYTYACICTRMHRQKILATMPQRVKQYHRRTYASICICTHTHTSAQNTCKVHVTLTAKKCIYIYTYTHMYTHTYAHENTCACMTPSTR